MLSLRLRPARNGLTGRPECGAPKIWRRLRFVAPSQLIEAHRVLRQAGIAHRVFEAGGYVVGMVTGLGVGLGEEIWVVHADSERVIEALESEGIAVPLPIVDVSEPACPACGNDLDRDESESCPAYGLLFRWVDVTDWETS